MTSVKKAIRNNIKNIQKNQDATVPRETGLTQVNKLMEKQDITAEFVLNGLRDLALSDNSGTAVRAYELLGKYLKLFTDKVEQQSTITYSSISWETPDDVDSYADNPVDKSKESSNIQ